jgi:aromatic ring-opening dioxygenase catalytic subunit (LigB family)
MAEIVCVMATTHTPGLLGWFDDAPPEQQQMALKAFDRMRAQLARAKPDVMIIFANDHVLNWPINNTPEYTIGISALHSGPADWYQPWLRREQKYRVPGYPAIARYLVNEGARRGLQFAYIRENMQFDDAISVPTYYLNPEMRIPLIPVTMNCTVPPIPTPVRAYEVGMHVREMLKAYPGQERIALIGSGGLSHEPGGPRYFFLDEEFDRWFLDRLAEGDPERLLRECTLERLEAAGSGGTAELIAWFVVLASTKGPAEVLDYCPSYAWRCSCSWVIWHSLLS